MSKLRTRIPAFCLRLFRTTQQNISLHLQNIYAEGEWQLEATHKESLSVRQGGGRTVRRRVDLSRTLQHPTQTGMLESTGARGAVYQLPGEAIATADDVFGTPARNSVPSSRNLGGSSPNLGENRDGDECLIADQLLRPIIDELSALGPGLCAWLEGIAAEPRGRGKVDREWRIAVIVHVCARQFAFRCGAAETVEWESFGFIHRSSHSMIH